MMLGRTPVIVAAAIAFCSLTSLSQAISGPTQMEPLDRGTFTITVTNTSSTQAACDLVITNTMPNAQFSYVTGTSRLTLHQGTAFTQDPSVSGLNLVWDIDAMGGAAYQLPPGESLTIAFDMATSLAAYTGTDTVTLSYFDCAFPVIPFQGTDSAEIAVISIGGCINDVTGTSNVCTANDVRISSLTVLEVLDGCTSPTDTTCLRLRVELISGAATRYDIGLFWSLDGGDARTGLCAHDYLPPPLAPLASYNPDGGPFYNADGDSCGDIEQGVLTYYDLPEYCFKCVDTNNDGFVDIGTAVSWDNQANATNCAGIADAVPGTKSKCRVEAIVTTVEIPNITLSKTANPTVVDPGDTFLVTIRYANVGLGNAYLTSFRDDYDESLGAVVNISGGGVDDGDQITWTIGTIPPGTSATLTYEYRVNSDVPGGALILNTVQTYYKDQPNQPVASATVAVRHRPEISIVKTGPASANVGDTITYTFTIANDAVNGDGSPIVSIQATDSVAGNATYVSGDDGDSRLEVGEAWTFSVSYTIQPTDPDPLANTATVTGQDLDGDSVSDTDTHSLAVEYDPAIQIVKTGPASANVGTTITYTFTVTNDAVAGDGSAIQNVSVIDNVAGAATYVSGDDGDTLLEVGESWTFQASYTIAPTDPDPLDNLATVTGQDLDGGPVSDADTHSLGVEYAPAIRIVKTGPASANVSDTVTYSFAVTNDSIAGDGSPIGNVTVTDSVAAAASYVSGDDGDTLLEVGETWTFTATHTIQATDPDPLVNTATVNGQDLDGDPVSDTGNHSLDVLFNPAIRIVKTGPASANVGTTITYTLTVTNDAVAGDGSPILNVSVSDNVAGTTDYVSGDDGDLLLEVGESWTFTAQYTIQVGDPDPLQNTATVTGEDRDGDPLSDTDSHSLDVEHNPAIAIVKTGPATADVGDTITYTFTVTHDTVSGDGTPISSVSVSDSVAGSAAYVSGDDGDLLLEAGETWTFQAMHVIPPTAPDPLPNTATVSGVDADGDVVVDQDGHLVAIEYEPSIRIVKSGPASADVGQTVTFSFAVTNDMVSGDGSPIQYVAVVDDIAGSASYVSGDDGDNVLEVGETWAFQATYTVQPTDPDPLQNTATVTGEDRDSDPVTDTDTHLLDVEYNPAIRILKSGPESAAVGDTVTYTFAVTNDTVSGDGSPILNVAVSDSVASNAAYVSGDDGDNLLEVGEAWTFSVSYTIQPADPDPLSNTATVTGQDLGGDPVSDQDTHSLGVAYAPAIRIVKSGPSTAAVGDTITYTFAVTNDTVSGDGSPIQNVTVTDDIAGSTVYVTGDDGDLLLEVGESWTYQASYTIRPTDPDPLTNVGTVNAQDLDGDPLSDQDAHSLDGQFDPAIRIVKSGPASASVGATITYTFAVTNDTVTGDGSPIVNVAVSDSLAGAATYVSGDDGDNVLQVGETWVFQIAYALQPDDPHIPGDQLLNTATVTGTDGDNEPLSDQDSHSLDVEYAPAIRIVKSGPATANTGETVTFSFAVTNDMADGDGSRIANVGVSDDVAGSAAYVSGDDGDALLEVGETWTFSVSHTIQATDPDPLVNTATATGQDRDGDPVSDSDNHSINVEFNPAIRIVKSGPAAAAVGDTVTYSFTVTNDIANGDGSPIGNLSVADNLAQSVAYVSGDDGDSVLEVGETWTFQASYAVQPTDPDPLVNIATATGEDLDGDPVFDQDSHSLDVQSNPAIAIVKNGPSSANVGGVVTYTFTVIHDTVTGDGSNIVNVTVTDDIAGPADYVSGDDGDGTLEVGETWIYTASHTDRPTDADPLQNTATVNGETLQGNPLSDQDDHSLSIEYSPAIQLVKSGPASAAAGDTVTYTFAVTNDDINGDDSNIFNVAVADSLAGAAVYVSGDDGDTVLEVGETWTFQANYTIKPTDPDPLTNTATVTGEDRDGDPVSDQDGHTLAVAYAPGISIEKSGPTTGARDETVTYAFAVTHDASNSDGSPIGSVSVTDNVAGPATYVSGDDGDGLLEVTETWIFEGFYTIPGGGPSTILNTATATGVDNDGDTVTSEDSHVLEIVADVAVSKVGSPSPVLPGGQLVYVIVVTNLGPEKAEDVVLDDFVPLSLLSVQISTNAGSTWLPWVGSIDLGTLEVNASRTLLIRGTVAASVIAPLTNQAQVSSSTLDVNQANNTAIETTPILRLADLAVTKIDAQDPVVSGEIVTYTIQVTNNGPIAAPQVTVIETIPAQTNWIEIVPSVGTFDPVTSTWSVGTLAVGQTETLELTVRVDPGYVGTLNDTARVTSDIDDPDPTNDVDEEVTTVLTELGGGGVADPAAFPCERAEAVADRLWFVTDEAMYASAEFLRTREAEELLAFDAQTLLPTWIRQVRADGVDTATDNLLQVHAGSGLGLALKRAPRVVEQARRTGRSPDQALEEMLDRYADLAGLGPDNRPENEAWIVIEYAAGDPRFQTRDDDLWPGGLWVEVDDSIDPSALGMSLLHQVRQIDRLTASSAPLDRYVGLVLSEIVMNKLLVLDEVVLLEGPSGVGRAIASDYRAADGDPLRIEATTTEYSLFDHVSMLLGLAEFISYGHSSKGESLFSADDLSRAEQLLIDLLDATEELFRRDAGVRGTWTAAGEAPAPIRDVGLLLLSLARAADAGNQATSNAASEWALELSGWLLAQQDASGGFPEQTILTGVQNVFTLADQAAAIRGLLATFERTADRRTLEAAQRILGFMNESLWDDRYGVYAESSRGSGLTYCYRPLDVGLVVGAARELVRVAEPEHVTDALARASRFFRAVVRDAGLHLKYAQAFGTYGTFSGSGFGEIAPLQWIDAPRGVSPVLQNDLCIEMRPATGGCCGIRLTSEPWFQTDAAMFASYELQRSFLDREDVADATLSNVVLHAGLGAPDEAGPWFVRLASNRGMQVEDLVFDRLSQYASLSGLNSAEVPEISPIALEYVSASPARVAESLAWDEATFFDRIEGAAIGMTLLREVQEATQLLESKRGTLYGQTPTKGFYGLLLAGAIQNKITFLTEIVEVMLARGPEAYVPHAVRLQVEDGRIRYEILDGSSRLFDLTSLLLGLREARTFLRDPAYAAFVGLGVVDSGAADDVDRLLGVVLDTIERRHVANDLGTIYERAEPLGGTWERVDPASLRILGLLGSALGSVVSEGVGLPETVFDALRAADPAVASSPLTDEFGLISGLLAAHAALARPADLDAAQRAFNRLATAFPIAASNTCGGTEWVPVSAAFRSGCTTPLDLGLAIRALERLADVSDESRSLDIHDWLESFVEYVTDELRLALPGGDWRTPTEAGTTELDRREYAPVLAREACFSVLYAP